MKNTTRTIDRYAMPLLPWAGVLLFVLATLGLLLGLRRCEVGVSRTITTSAPSIRTCDPPCKPPEWCDTRSRSCAMPAKRRAADNPRPELDATDTRLQLELR